MVESARRTNSFFGLGKDSHFYSCISSDYIGGKMMAVRAIVAEGRLTCEKPSNRPLADYKGEKIDLLAVVPSQMLHLIESGKDLGNIGAIIIGGAPLPKSLREKIAERGINAFETYGMTETSSHVALKKIDGEAGNFVPLDGVHVSVNEENRIKIEIDTECSLNLFNGLDFDGGTHGPANRFSILTNDLGEVFEDGSFKIKGRIDNIINSGGIKINPIEIEEVLESEFGCDILITSEADDKWGEKLVMIIEQRELSENEILNRCRAVLHKEYVPKKILMGPIPRTENGKKCRKIQIED